MLFERLINEGMSLSRFGDGEFAIINGKKRGWFQKNDDKLAVRLYGILNSRQDRVIIGIPDMFGSLDRYTDIAADDMREFLTGPVRNEIMNYLPPDRTYGDAYVTRPYYIYRDKTNMKAIMSLFRKLWHGRNVLILENRYARIGIGNDLLDGAGSIRRIICPNVNAFDYYEKIMESACKHADKNDLILISLGQTATVLAYDLGTAGYHAIDIGQLDTEYEWYLRNASGRIEIPGKAVSEIMWWHEPEQHDNGEYNRQVIISIGDP
jgi:glycosyltransferase family protein